MATSSGQLRVQGEQSWRDAWNDALAAVEVDVDAAEELLAHLHGNAPGEPPVIVLEDWVAPSLTGPVPMEFADRARRLLQRQLDVRERLAEALAQLRAQRRMVTKLEAAAPPPVYYDRAL
ncbi:hypothetical protein GCM10023225_21010 [Kineococcus glutinatus]|uniref:Uncharacterized protein n=2 Tax=Kineococcus glutinatus TaxID=1070872 RepID=A0ABP9HXD9_9ACTN